MALYLPRILDQTIAQRMNVIGAILIEGPKACGKTATATQFAATTIRLDQDDSARAAVTIAPQTLFDNPTPILFDEWQLAPALWNRVRREVDDRGAHGLYLLTGSATPANDPNRHSGAGRIGSVRMRPMTLLETGHSTGEISLAALFDGHDQSASDTGASVADLVRRIVIGGWPSLLEASEADARHWLDDYLAQIVDVDVPALGARRNPRNLRRLLASLGRAVGQATKQVELARDVGGDSGAISSETLTAYLDALTRLGLTDDSEAWQPHMRSRTRLRSASVRYFVDPSLGPAALGVGSARLLRDLNATGFHFEALAVRELRVYSQPLGGIVESWRDSNGNEVDAVITLRDGRWGAFEVKLDPSATDDAAKSLLRFAASVDTRHHGTPAVLAVITSTGYGYRRPDGVHVVPVTTLGP